VTHESGRLKFRWRSFWWTIPKRLQVLMVVLIAAGVATATGTLVSQLNPTQEVTGLGLTITPDPDTTDVVVGVPFSFSVRVTNPSDTAATVHLSFDMSACPASGDARISFASGSNLCNGFLAETGSLVVLANDYTDFGPYSMTFYAAGTYTWDVEAHV